MTTIPLPNAAANPATNTAHDAQPSGLAELAELARLQAQNALRKIPALGAATWLMLQQPSERTLLLGDLEWRVLPPLLRGQARLFMKDEAPVGYAAWAFLSEEAAERWRQPPHRLALHDWNSGAQLWLIDLLAPFGGAKRMLDELRAGAFAGRELRQLLPLPGHAPKDVVWPARPAGPAATATVAETAAD